MDYLFIQILNRPATRLRAGKPGHGSDERISTGPFDLPLPPLAFGRISELPKGGMICTLVIFICLAAVPAFSQPLVAGHNTVDLRGPVQDIYYYPTKGDRLATALFLPPAWWSSGQS